MNHIPENVLSYFQCDHNIKNTYHLESSFGCTSADCLLWKFLQCPSWPPWKQRSVGWGTRDWKSRKMFLSPAWKCFWRNMLLPTPEFPGTTALLEETEEALGKFCRTGGLYLPIFLSALDSAERIFFWRDIIIIVLLNGQPPPGGLIGDSYELVALIDQYLYFRQMLVFFFHWFFCLSNKL